MGLSAPLGGTECWGREATGCQENGLLSVAALSPKFEVRPQNGGRCLRTFEPERQVHSALALENLIRGHICLYPGFLRLEKTKWGRKTSGGTGQHLTSPPAVLGVLWSMQTGLRGQGGWRHIPELEAYGSWLSVSGGRWVRVHQAAGADMATPCSGFVPRSRTVSAQHPGPFPAPFGLQIKPTFVSGWLKGTSSCCGWCPGPV